MKWPSTGDAAVCAAAAALRLGDGPPPPSPVMFAELTRLLADARLGLDQLMDRSVIAMSEGNGPLPEDLAACQEYFSDASLGLVQLQRELSEWERHLEQTGGDPQRMSSLTEAVR